MYSAVDIFLDGYIFRVGVLLPSALCEGYLVVSSLCLRVTTTVEHVPASSQPLMKERAILAFSPQLHKQPEESFVFHDSLLLLIPRVESC